MYHFAPMWLLLAKKMLDDVLFMVGSLLCCATLNAPAREDKDACLAESVPLVSTMRYEKKQD
jgi:hypothetical protein